MDETNFIEGLTSVLNSNSIRYCVIGAQGVNAYVESLVSLDLDLVIATPDLPRAEEVLAEIFKDGTVPEQTLLDIERLLEAYPHLRPLVPQTILDRLNR